MKVVKFEYSLFGINTYVVVDEKSSDCAVIDPGMINEEEEEALTSFISRHGLNVTHLVNTHMHIDHAVGDRMVSDRYGVPVEAHAEDGVLGTRLQQQAMMFGMTERVQDVSIGRTLSEGDTIHIGTGCLEVLHVPGHSPGSIVLYDREGGYILAGDVLFSGSIGRTDLPGGDMGILMQGIKGKLLTLPDSTVVYPGHGPATTIGAERRSNPFLRQWQ